MDLERLEELVVLAAAMIAGAILALPSGDRIWPERFNLWASSMGSFRRPIGFAIIAAVLVVAIFG
jgi:hypothetical protein